MRRRRARYGHPVTFDPGDRNENVVGWEPTGRQDMSFNDRVDAGRELAGRLRYLVDTDVVVLGLPRARVPIACEVATGKDNGGFIDDEIVRAGEVSSAEPGPAAHRRAEHLR